jgi:SAM-dependent methyltransferase
VNAEEWDQRYAQVDLVWSAGPNLWVEQVAAGLSPGAALDLGAGEGRNALWLAQRGWRVTAVDFSSVAIEKASAMARGRLPAGSFDAVCADVLTYEPAPQSYDLVLLVYLQLPAGQRRSVLTSAAGAVRPGGRLLVVAHDTENLAHGYGGPQDAEVLYSAADVTADLTTSGLRVDRAEQVVRSVSTDAGDRSALDVLVVASRPARAGTGSAS